MTHTQIEIATGIVGAVVRICTKLASECDLRECCGEPFCVECQEHYAERQCVTPPPAMKRTMDGN